MTLNREQWIFRLKELPFDQLCEEYRLFFKEPVPMAYMPTKKKIQDALIEGKRLGVEITGASGKDDITVS